MGKFLREASAEILVAIVATSVVVTFIILLIIIGITGSEQ